MLALFPFATVAGVTHTTQTEVQLRRGTSDLGKFDTERECISAAKAQPAPKSGTLEYECLGRTRVVANFVADPPPPPPLAMLASGKGAPNINPFSPANKRDELDAALIRLARTTLSADLSRNEPWLFDRATVFYKLSLWTGEDDFRKYAFNLVGRYYSMINDKGHFALKPDDAKYAYIDGAVWYERETKDRQFRPKAEAIYKLWLAEMPARYSPAVRFWTEREIAYSLAAAMGWYELTEDPKAMGRAREMIQQWITMSEGIGAPLHTLAQHQEEFEPPYGPQQMTSPWMAALFFEQVKIYHRLTNDPRALRMISDYADFLLANCLYDGSVNHPNLKGYLMPYYMCGENRSYYDRETPSESDGEHTPDVMGLFAFAVHAKKQLGLDATPAMNAYRELRRSATFFVARRQDVDPPRKINWWIGTSYDAAYLVQ